MLSNEVCRRAKHSSGFVRFFSNPILIVLTVAFFLMLPLSPYAAQAATETILHNFTCGQSDGCNPQAGVILDGQGNLYGTTYSGGAYGWGTVFKLSPSGTLTILHSFNPGAFPYTDGCYPQAGVVFGPDGSLYGTANACGTDGGGIVFRVTPSGTETVLYNFTGEADGCLPQASMVFDSEGNIYGTAPYCGAYGWGTVFKLSPSVSGIGTGPFTTLYGFTGGTDGGYPLAGLLLGPKETNLYGTTDLGGTHGFGTVFRVNISSGKETVLHSFNANGKDGFHPEASLIPGSTGTVFGTTADGGTVGVGTIFEVSVSGTETIIYSFQAGKDGRTPLTGIVATGTDEGCGVTWYGGTSDLGTVYCGNTSGAETVLHSFTHNGKDGYNPNGPLALDKSGNLYGTTIKGGNGGCGVYGCGTVFKIVP